MSNFGNWVNTVRRQKRWSQRQLALKAHISNTEIARIERAERRSPSVDVVVKIAAAFGVSVVDVLIEAGFVSVDCLEGYAKLTEKELSIVADYRRLDERGKEAVVETVRRELRYAVG